MINGSTGNDTIEFLGTINGFYTLNYGFGVGAIDVNLGATSGTIVKGAGGVNGTDTLLNVDMINGIEGGLQIRGSNADDTFTVDASGVEWLAIRGGADFGDDTINRVGTDGTIRVDLRDFEGVNVNAATGNVVELFAAGPQATLTVTDNNGGVGFIDEWRGSFYDDIFVGSAGNDRFITETGNDNVDGGGGIDTVRYNRSGVGNLAVVYSSPMSAVVAGTWFGVAFMDNLTSIERIIGSDQGVDQFVGAAGNEIFEGRGGAGYFNAGGGDDLLKASGDADLFIIGPGNGNDVIRNFMIGEDMIDLSQLGLAGSTAFIGYTFDGDDTLIDFGGGNTLTVEGVDLTDNADSDAYIFTAINGTAGNDTLTGFGANERLDGLGGNDIINAGGGNDVLLSGGSVLDFDGVDRLYGEAGDDVLIAEGGRAVLQGGQGNDLLFALSPDDPDYAGDADFDSVRADYADAPAGIVANLTGGAGAGAAAGLDAYQIADGHTTVDTIGSGVRVIGDSDHNDIFFIDNSFNNGLVEVRLSEGDDTVNFLSGSGGRRISYKNASDGVDANLATGTATDNNASGNGVDDIGTDNFMGANQLRGSDFSDTLTGDGNNNRFRGSGGDDTIDGGGGIDTVDYQDSPTGISVGMSVNSYADGFGNNDSVSNVENVIGSYFDDGISGDAFDNVIYGLLGQDNISGNGGADRINGGKGADILGGGSGADTFEFDTLDGTVDTVTDFSPVEDVFDLSAILDDAFAPGSPDSFVEVVVSGGNATVRVDTNDVAGSNMTDIATLTGVTSGTFNFVYDDNNNSASVIIA